MILVAGDHDEVTQAVVRQLLDAGLGVRVLVETPVDLTLLAAGAQVALYRSGARLSVQSAFDGVIRVCLPACRTDSDARMQVDCIECATSLSVSRVVKLCGAMGMEGDAPSDAADRGVEQALKQSPLLYTVVRHTITFQDLWFLATTDISRGASGMPNVAAVDAEDVAMVVLDSLVDDDVAVPEELVTGPAPIALEECCARIRRAREASGAPESAADRRLWRRGPWSHSVDPSIVTDTIARVTGEEPASFEVFLERKSTSSEAAP